MRSLNNVPSSIYTDDGLRFFSWPQDVDAVRSPMASDPFDRIYYTTPDDFRVTSRSGMSTNGGVPSSSYRVGVPNPTQAPQLSISGASPLASCSLTSTFHYEYSGVKYQEQAVALNIISNLSKWFYTPPTKSYTAPTRDPISGEYSTPSVAATPGQALPVVRLTFRDLVTGAVVLDLYSENSSLNTNKAWSLSTAKYGGGTDYSLSLQATVDESEKITRAYVYTYVNTYNEESAPSPARTIVIMPNNEVSVQVSRDPSYDYAPLKEIRIYRTPDSSDVAEYFYVGSIPILGNGSTSFVFYDNVKMINQELSSYDCYPPNPYLVGLTSLPNGIFMAWRGNELHFSEPYKPWSWPPSYVKIFKNVNIVGAMAVGSGAIVTTTGRPFRISGVSPDSMTEADLNIQQAGVSKWAIADIGRTIFYASNDGIVAYDGGIPTMAFSERYFTREVWRSKYASGLDTMRFAVYDGRLLVFSSAGTFTPFMIDFDEANGSMTELPQLSASCAFISPLADQCYLIRGSTLYQFFGGGDLTAFWMSRELVLNEPTNFGYAQAVCRGNWTISFYADGILRHQEVLNASKNFRLPSGFRSDRWKFSLSGSGAFRELRISQSARDLGKF